jgi:hypothetical protein
MVGDYACRMSFTEKDGLRCEWHPQVPLRIDWLPKEQLQQYRRGRDTLLALVAEDLGGHVLVIEQ